MLFGLLFNFFVCVCLLVWGFPGLGNIAVFVAFFFVCLFVVGIIIFCFCLFVAVLLLFVCLFVVVVVVCCCFCCLFVFCLFFVGFLLCLFVCCCCCFLLFFCVCVFVL